MSWKQFASNSVRTCRQLLSALLVSSAPLAVLAEDCELRANEVYNRLEGSTLQVFAASINPYLVFDRYGAGTGTGFVYGDGYLLTNYHVIADADEIIAFTEDDFYPVEIVGVDPTLDIAVLQPPFWFPSSDSIEPADWEGVEIGEEVFAIGYPLGIGKTISSGIISGKGRVLPRTTSSWMVPLLQTDAAISPGNSGGPLVDACGNLVGMITSGVFEKGAENIGFAIPIEILEPVVEEIIQKGHVSRPWHGLFGQMTFPPILQILGVPEAEWDEMHGFLVETVEPGSAADRIGLRGGSWPMMWGGREILLGGDVITHVNGQRIDDLSVALELVRGLEIGSEVHLEYVRDGYWHVGSVKVEERPILERELEIYRYRR